jgi:hypothetical protein
LFSWLEFQDESDQATNWRDYYFVPLPFHILDRLSGYIRYYNNNQPIYRRAELDFTENKCRVIDEIERPAGYGSFNIQRKRYYAAFANDQEIVVCKFDSTNNKTRLKFTPVLRYARNGGGSLDILSDDFLIFE